MRLCLLLDDEADLVSLVRNGATEEDLALHIERALQRKQERHDGVGYGTTRTSNVAHWRIIWDF